MRIDILSKVDRLRCVLRRQKATKVFDDDVCVVVGFHEPVGVVEVAAVDVIEGQHRFRRKMLAASEVLRHLEYRQRSVEVVLLADE